jgi:hypothetical protein
MRIAVRSVLAMSVTVALAAPSCDSGGSGGAAIPASGEACATENEIVCGKATGGKGAAVLACVPAGQGGLSWSESSVCKAFEVCTDGACVIDCDSPKLCDGVECGDDGCGDTCGGCAGGLVCVGGQCMEFACDPACGAAACGPDGCGGECGACTGDTVCAQETFTCVAKPSPCLPACAGHDCGPNGCGGSCGLCTGGTFCVPGSLTCERPCIPSCVGKECGDDGCGGTCGGCLNEGEFCSPDGQCLPCDPVANTMCPEGMACTYESGATKPSCVEAGTQQIGEPCGGVDTCAEGVCIEITGSGEGPMCYGVCDTNDDCGEGVLCMTLGGVPYKLCGGASTMDEPCNLLDQDCTVEGDGCYFSGTAAICMSAGEGLEGSACSGQPNDCAAGLTCVSVSGGGWICLKFCTKAPGVPDGCDVEGDFPLCKNYFAAQQAGLCHPGN